jgi:hypothetical protein
MNKKEVMDEIAHLALQIVRAETDHKTATLQLIELFEQYDIVEKPKTKLFAEVDAEILKQWQAARKKKRAAELSKIVYNAMVREANLAGISVEQAVTVCIERSWITFVAEWYKKTLKPMKGHGVISDEKFNDWLNGGANGQLS